MPNGVSCAFFAARNHIYGKKEHNIFKEGIAGIQTARTADSVLKASTKTMPALSAASDIIGKIANTAKKILYPLIVVSGIYNTVKSKDKVKTGAINAGGIGTMIAFERVAEKGLNKLNQIILNSKIGTNNKYVKSAWYVLKGAAFVTASMTGYALGSKTAGKAIDSYRKKHPKIQNIEDNNSEQKISAEELFSDMKL